MQNKFTVLLIFILIFVGIIFISTEIIDFPNKEAIVYENKNKTSDISATYTLELDRWNVYKDGTHPIETTNGINEALI